MSFWVYILRCADGSFYTGQTEDLDQRMAQHKSGEFETCYTYSRRPVKLEFYEEFPTREEAFSAERQIKGWNRAKKDALIRGDWSELSRLSRSKNKTPETE